MIGLVVVSHSAKLAEGVAELMRGMAGPDVRIALAGGLDLPDRPLGTDVNLIYHAIEEVYSEAGVLVLVDLGSAILSTEMAFEMLPPEQRTHVMLAPAPLVEGGIAAAVQAKLGSDLNTVLHEARTALDAKLSQLDEQAPAIFSSAVPNIPLKNQMTRTITLSVTNRLGLHARPAARFVQTAARFKAEVQLRDVSTQRGPVNAKSINAVTTLGVLSGHSIEISATGPEAQGALEALKQLAAENFGDVDARAEVAQESAVPAASSAVTDSNELVGLAASAGYAIGPAQIYQPTAPPVPQDKVADPDGEWVRLQAAIEQAHIQLRASRQTLNGHGAVPEAEIFDAQALMLEDEALLEPARRAIYDDKANAALAMDTAANMVVAQYNALHDQYLRARAADVRAVTRLVLLNLLGAIEQPNFGTGVLIAPDLTPAETASLDPKTVQAICTAYGGPTGHSAILAKALGIPAVVGLGEAILQVKTGVMLLVDGGRGRIWVNPSQALLDKYAGHMAAAQQTAESNAQQRNEPALTQDGHHVRVAANIGSVKDAMKAVEMGAEEVGLFRTEFLFLDRRDAPTEEEQYQTYRTVAEALHGRPLLIRTLDIGGDKPLPYTNLPEEANPFLGLRGLRFSLANPDLFKVQLRAILRVAAEFPLRVMFPMVTKVPEFRMARDLLAVAREELDVRDMPPDARVELGIMVEVPAAAIAAAQFAKEVDFFSIGTNDLTQYTLAAERGNASVASLADSFHPAVLQLISNVVDAAHAQKKWVGVCGEMGGDPKAIPLLVGLGVDELSMAPPLIPAAKQIVRGLTLEGAKAQAEKAIGGA